MTIRRIFFFLVLPILVAFSSPGDIFAIQLTGNNFIVRDPVISGIGGYSSATGFQLFSSGDLVMTGRSGATLLGRFGFLYFPFVTQPSLSATPGDAFIDLSWTASTAGLGFTVSGYEYGVSTSSGGPYTFSNVGNVLNATATGLTNGTTYYFVVRTLDFYGTPIITSEQISASPNGLVIPPPPGGGGGSSGSPQSFVGVTFSGLAYPQATVTIMKNAVPRATTRADVRGAFSTTLQEPYEKNILYTLYADDLDRERSLLLNYPLVVQDGASTAQILNVKFAPTIKTDKIATKKGDPINFSGFSLPNNSLEFLLSGESSETYTRSSENSGRYNFSLNTSNLDFGQYEIKTRYPADPRSSLVIQFSVGSNNVLKEPDTTTLPGDCNSDNVINLRDFSVLAFWYGKDNPPVCIDTNRDGIINLVDFSILAFYWTG